MKFISLQLAPSKCWKDAQGKLHRTAVDTFRETSIPVNESLGFAPLWAVPVTTFQETMTRMLLMAPTMPQLCCVFDTDDYVRIDKVAYHQLLNEHKGNLEGVALPVADPELPDYLCEYCLDASKVEPVPRMMGEVLCVETLLKDGTGFGPALNQHMVKKLPADWEKKVAAYLRSMPKYTIDPGEAKLLGQAWQRLQMAWFSYRYTILPVLLWGLCLDTRAQDLTDGQYGIYLGALEACRHSLSRLMNLSNQFAAWTMGDCSLADYQELYAKVRDGIVDSLPLLEAWASNKPIGRNDLCPCGSGLKFKKCHGRYVD